MTRPKRYTRSRALSGPAQASRLGFTLTELLVAMAIFVSLMAGVTLLFIGATRTSQQGFQNQEAYEIARGAMNLMQRDLSRAFTSRQHGDLHSFYGTPIGFTFVGLASPHEDQDPNIARVTYVIHQRVGGPVPRDVDDNLRQIYDLIRYVETGAEDLDSYPVNWTGLILVDGSGFSLEVVVQNARAQSLLPGEPCFGNADCADQVENAMRRELWIRMLSEMEIDVLPDLWGALDGGAGQDPIDYVLAENLWDTQDFPFNPADAVPVVPLPETDTFPFFEYAQFSQHGLTLGGEITGVVPNIVPPTLTNITSFRHALSDGTRVVISGVNEPAIVNGPFYITRIDDDSFSIVLDTTAELPYDGGGNWLAERTITDATSLVPPIQITDLGHGLAGGEEVVVSEVLGNTAANANKTVTFVGLDDFTLDGTTANNAYAGGGTWVLTGDVAAATNAFPIQITDASHGLQTGRIIRVGGVEGNTAANGDWTVTRVDNNNFLLDGSTGNGVYTVNGGWIETTGLARSTSGFWHDTRNINLIGSPLDPHLPQMVLTKFTLFLTSPAPGAPDFQRTFKQRIDIPGGYQRFTRN